MKPSPHSQTSPKTRLTALNPMVMQKTLAILDRSVEALIVIIFIVMTIVGGLQVFNRFVLNQSLSWSEEFQKFSHIWLIYLTIAVGYNRGAHIGMRLLVGKLPQKIQDGLVLLTDLLWLLFAGALIIYTHVIMGVARFQTSPGLGIRMDWIYLGLLVGGGYLFICVLRNLFQNIRKMINLESGAG